MEKLYTITAAAKELYVSRPTIYKWIKRGQLKLLRINGIPKIKESEIKRLRGDLS